MSAVAFLIFSSAIGIAIFWAKNRNKIYATSKARSELQKRALASESGSVEYFLKNTCTIQEHEFGARILLSELSDMLKVNPQKIAQNYTLNDLLVFINTEERDKSIDPFSYELVERVANQSDKELWEQRWRNTPGLPSNEDALVEFISKMTVCEFLRFFSPLIKKPT